MFNLEVLLLRGRTTARSVGLVSFHEDIEILQVEDQIAVSEDRVSTLKIRYLKLRGRLFI